MTKEKASNLKIRSWEVTDGPQRAPARSMLRAMGLTDADLARPLFGVANSWSEGTACPLNLRGGMRASLVSREVIADSIELVMHAHRYDALVTCAGCDKTIPGSLMAIARLDLPAVFTYGGPALAGRFQGRDVTIQDMFEAVGAFEGGRRTAGG